MLNISVWCTKTDRLPINRLYNPKFVISCQDIQFGKTEYLIKISKPQAMKLRRPRFLTEAVRHFDAPRREYLRCNLTEKDPKSGL